MSNDVTIEPCRVDLDAEVINDLKDRLLRTRWPQPSPNGPWMDGPDVPVLQDVAARWVAFDWGSRQAKLNRLRHYRATVDGLAIHFVHERGLGPQPLPLVLTHGWPGTFAEYAEVVDLLTDPAAGGADPADSFDVVVPSLPGFGLSAAATRPGMTSDVIADLWAQLMVGLGYQQFGAHGTDIGAGVTARLGRDHPTSVVGIHLASVGLPAPSDPRTAAEREYATTGQVWDHDEGAYAHVHRTRPQTLGAALNDSPAGLAAWLFEKLHDWSSQDRTDLDWDWVLTTLTLYWATATITSSLRPYAENPRHVRPLDPGSPVQVPTAFATFGPERRPMPKVPRELAERYFHVVRWTDFPSGGHFPAVDAPHVLAQDLRDFFRPLRNAGKSPARPYSTPASTLDPLRTAPYK